MLLSAMKTFVPAELLLWWTDITTQNAKTIIIGLDGVPFDMIADFADAGVMPNTADLISRSVFKKMHSSIPEVSSVAWSSMMTGCNPGQHGTFGIHPQSGQPGAAVEGTPRSPALPRRKKPPLRQTCLNNRHVPAAHALLGLHPFYEGHGG